MDKRFDLDISFEGRPDSRPCWTFVSASMPDSRITRTDWKNDTTKTEDELRYTPSIAWSTESDRKRLYLDYSLAWITEATYISNGNWSNTFYQDQGSNVLDYITGNAAAQDAFLNFFMAPALSRKPFKIRVGWVKTQSGGDDSAYTNLTWNNQPDIEWGPYNLFYSKTTAGSTSSYTLWTFTDDSATGSAVFGDGSVSDDIKKYASKTCAEICRSLILVLELEPGYTDGSDSPIFRLDVPDLSLCYRNQTEVSDFTIDAGNDISGDVVSSNTQNVKFNWEYVPTGIYSCVDTPVQSNGTLYWRKTDSSWNATPVNGATMSTIIASGTFPRGMIEWYVSSRDVNGNTYNSIHNTFSTQFFLSINKTQASCGDTVILTANNRNGDTIHLEFTRESENTPFYQQDLTTETTEIICPISWFTEYSDPNADSIQISIAGIDSDGETSQCSFILENVRLGVLCDKQSVMEDGTVTISISGRISMPLQLDIYSGDTILNTKTVNSDSYEIICNSGWFHIVGNYDIDTLPITARVSDEYGRTASCNFTVTSKPEIVVQPTDISIGDGHEAYFEITARRGAIRYQWQYSDDGIAWGNITNGVSASLAFTAALSQDGRQYRCIVSNSIGSVTSETAILHVLEVPVIQEQPQTVTVLPGTPIGFSVSATGGMLTYQWQRKEPDADDWTDLPGETAASIEKTALDADDGAQYRCVISNDIDDTISQAAAIQIIRVPSIDEDIFSVTVTEGDDVTLAMQVSGYHLAYRWEKSADGSVWNEIEENEDTLRFTAVKAESGYRYRCTISNEAGSSTSSIVSVTVLLKTEITAQPEDAEVAENDDHTFTVSVTGEENLQYQWQTISGDEWEDIDGANATSLSIHAFRNTDGSRYRCAISNEIGTVYSNGAYLYVIYQPVIIKDPESVDAVVGSEITLAVQTENSKPNYQWKQSSDGEAWEDSVFEGAQTNMLHVPSTKENDGIQFKCVVFNLAGGDTSEPATVRIYSPIVIDRQPVDLSVTAGEIGNLSITVSGEELAYIWQRYDEEADEWVNMSDISADSIGIFVTDQEDNMQFRCVVSNPAETVISDTATIHVFPDVTITEHPVNTQGIVGQEATFTCEAYGAITAYQWQERNPDGEWTNTMRTGSATPTLAFTVDEASDGAQFRCVVTGVYYTATSNVAVLDAVALPQITLQPVGATVMETKQTSFSINATGKYLSYQWQLRATSNDEWRDMTTAGSNSASINITGTRRLSGYQFRCAVSNIAGTVYSELAVLTVNLTVFKLADEGDGTYRNVLPRGDYIFSTNADRDGVLFSLGFGNEYETTWLCENQETPFAFYSDGTRPIRIFIYDKDGYDLNGCVIQPMLESGVRAHAWVSPVQKAHDIVNDFNYDWFSIGNTYESQENVVTATMPCEMTIRYRPIWKDTL